MSKLIELTTPRMNTKLWIWVIMACQCGFILDKKKCTILVSYVDNGGGYECVWAMVIWEISVPPSPFFCKRKTALKIKALKTKKYRPRNT